nr:reverse transcriptase domain-containing protein [Tanacetum cinerariifolium]
MAAEGNGDLPVPDLRIIEELFQPSLNGRGGPIASIAIQATNFGIKNDVIQQVQNSCQFHGLLGDDANKHLDKFLHVTQSIKVNRVTDDALRLYLFPHSLTHHATAWFDCLLRNSINTFEQMAKMFLEKYFPPSMVMKLRNEITNFRQRPDESLFEAWERHKLLINRCPNHNMRNLYEKASRECYDLIENMTAHHNDWDTSGQRSESSSSITSSDTEIAALKAEMAEINKNLMRVLQRRYGGVSGSGVTPVGCGVRWLRGNRFYVTIKYQKLKSPVRPESSRRLLKRKKQGSKVLKRNEFMTAADAHEEIERVKVNCTLEDTLQQASTFGTQSDNAPNYD